MMQVADTKALVAKKTEVVYHSLFSSPDADVVLATKEGIHFRVHSYTLKNTSGWFRSMFSLPQKDAVQDDHPVLIYVDEDAGVLEALLRCVCGLEIPRLDTYDLIEPLLFAAEKYDMPGPPSIVRALVQTPPLLDDPLRLYALACRNGWYDEAKRASTATLSLNLYRPDYRKTLQKLTSVAILALLDLHRKRREVLRTRLNEPPFVSDSEGSTCSHCGAPVDYHTWRELKYCIVLEMDARPLGDKVCEPGLSEWPEARACWEARCNNCNRVLYDKRETLRVIKECIEQLPSVIECVPPPSCDFFYSRHAVQDLRASSRRHEHVLSDVVQDPNSHLRIHLSNYSQSWTF